MRPNGQVGAGVSTLCEMVAVLVDGSVVHFTLSLIAMMLSLNIDALRER